VTGSVRVRFAPSPTGYFHVGSARSALFNWAVARQQGGTFVLRIEDTDASRNSPEWTDGIISALAWLGIDSHDPAFEGPYFQSQNADKQLAAARTLYDAKKAYYCDCTREDIVARHDAQFHGYDGHCRDRGLEQAPGRALRFRTPDEGTTVVEDVIRGKPEFENKGIEDFVILRGDGSVLFLLANVVDDIEQRITQVIRGEEHLPNTPKQQLLWEALGHTPPTWAHVPVLVNEKRQKLSKRRDKVALEGYREEGYLADAMINYLMLLGWAPGNDREILPWSEMEREFRVADVTPSPAFFDEKKLRAFNGEYIRAMSTEDFVQACTPWLSAPHATWAPSEFDPEIFAKVAPLAQTRVAVLSEITNLVDFFFLAEPPTDEASWAKAMTGAAPDLLAATAAAYAGADWSAEELKARLEAVGAERGLKLGKAQAPVRVATTGRTVGLPLFESLQLLGREKTLARIDAARARL
jgi:glutamyl-tRNA synthetase